MLRCTHPSYRRRNVFEAAIHTEPGASGTHEPPSGGPHIGGAPATPIAALSGSTHKAPGSAGGYLLVWCLVVDSRQGAGGRSSASRRLATTNTSIWLRMPARVVGMCSAWSR